MPTLDTISYTPAFRHTIDRDTNPNFTKPGRYILGSNGHFRGLVVHSDGTLIITTDHRTANNIVIDRRWLLDMQSEAVFRVAPFSLDADSGGIGSRDLPTHSQGCVERLNEGSGGSHLSAGAAVASASLDLRGGAVLLPELLQLSAVLLLLSGVPIDFSSMFEEHETTSAEQKSLERLSSGFGSTRASSRSSSDTGNVQVVGDCSNYQFVTTPAHSD